MEPIYTFDDVIPDPAAYRAFALSLPYESFPVGTDLFHGIAPTTDPRLRDAIVRLFDNADPGLTFFRRSPLGQPDPHYIHTDSEMGDWTAVLFLNDPPHPEDGLLFWERLTTGHRSGDWSLHEEQVACADRLLFQPHQLVPARFNRLVLFQADLYHSRAIPENYGEGDEARLIQVAFGRWSVS